MGSTPSDVSSARLMRGVNPHPIEERGSLSIELRRGVGVMTLIAEGNVMGDA